MDQCVDLLTFGFVCPVYERRQHVTIFYVKVVVWTDHIGRNGSCVMTTMLLEVSPVITKAHIRQHWEQTIISKRAGSFHLLHPYYIYCFVYSFCSVKLLHSNLATLNKLNWWLQHIRNCI